MADDENIEATDETPTPVVPAETIKTVRHIHQMSHEDFVRMHLTLRQRLDDMPTRTAEGVAVQARIDHGRWVVDCPFCPGAELVDLEDLRFFDLSCYNAEAQGQWLPVVLPSEEQRQAIEKAILERPAQFRHWRPEQTVVDVQTENALHSHW